jgi:hypothetical protein
LINRPIIAANGVSSPSKLLIIVSSIAWSFGSLERERVTRPLSKHCEKGKLRASVAFAKRMNGIQFRQFRQKVRRLRGKIAASKPRKCFRISRSANSRRISRSMCSG